MNRRSLLALLGAAPLTGPAVMKSVMEDMPNVPLPPVEAGLEAMPRSLGGNSPWSIIGPMRDRREVSQYVSQGHVPPHIGTKRSWSVAFKAHVELQERAEMREWQRRLEVMDAAGLTRIARLMGIEQ